jgi:Protein of unknown function (DUF3106)
MVKALAVLTFGLCVALSTLASAAEKRQPDWSQLTPEQQQILAPLASDWNNFDATRRRKWLLTAKRYPLMKPEQQHRLRAKMRRWAELTPEQRRIARENYRKLAKQSPQERETIKRRWQERQKLKQARPDAAPPAASGSITASGSNEAVTFSAPVGQTR